ncbi:MAG: hypothetical protein A4E65_03696 [Syntrophorhabdus sp. PtaU1.Bin153]|nr:MAG: hypothetical protein A4E65_03696 [Syntrophorhabdus sp. PtaU1.Bin153]
MKKLLLIAAVIAVLLPSLVMAAGSCTQTAVRDAASTTTVIKFECTGDAADGSIPNTAINAANMALILDKAFLYLVRAYPTAGGTAPDAADVFILDAAGEDYLGSADGGTTANKGANLIHATLAKSALPYSYNAGTSFYFPVTSTLTLKVANQATASADYTIEMVFSR